MDANKYFCYQVMAARNNYTRTGDWNAYLADCVYAAVLAGANALAKQNRRAFENLPFLVRLSRYGIKGVVESARVTAARSSTSITRSKC